MASFLFHGVGTQPRSVSSDLPAVAAGRWQAGQQNRGGSMGLGCLWLWPALGEGSTKWRQKSQCWAQRGQHSGWGSSCPGVMAVRSLAQAQLSWHLGQRFGVWTPVAPWRELGLGLEQQGQPVGQAAVYGCSPRGCRAGRGCAGPEPWPAAWGSGAGTRRAGWAV